MPRYFLEIAFKGTNYHGWQKQLNAVSVQSELERVLAQLLQIEMDTMGCGRTDSGVHADQFFVHFDLPEAINEDSKFLRGLNGLLPFDIAAKRLIPVDDDAHARFHASNRSYRYELHQLKDPFLTDRSYLFTGSLDLDRMNKAAEYLIGQHEFDSFCKTGSDIKTTICTVLRAEWKRPTDGQLRFVIAADRFLRNMVRAVVGTLIEIGRGDLPATHMSSVMRKKDRGSAGTSVPACGLYLHSVQYPFIAE